MTKLWAVNSNNDIYAERGYLVLSSDEAGTGQWAEHAVKTMVGECIYNTALGTNMLTSVFSNPVDLPLFESSIRSQISRLAPVNAVTNVTSVVVNNTVVYEATIQTLYGEITIRGALPSVGL